MVGSSCENLDALGGENLDMGCVAIPLVSAVKNEDTALFCFDLSQLTPN